MRAAPAVSIGVLLLVLASAPASGQTEPVGSEGLLLEIVDPSNDVTVSAQGQNGPPLPSSDYVNKIDVTRLRILDPDEEYLVFEVSTQAPFYRPPSYSGQNVMNVYHNIQFTIPGQGGIKIPAMIQLNSFILSPLPYVVSPPDPQLILGHGIVCFLASHEQQTCDFFEGRYTSAEVVEGRAVVKVPKTLLLRSEEHRVSTRSAALPTRLLLGDEFTDVHVRASSSGTGTFFPPVASVPRLSDRAPNTGMQSFRLAHSSPTGDIRFSRIPGAVVAGETSALPIEIMNLGSSKRIINLSIEPISVSKDGPWDVSITPRVTLASGKGTNLTIRVTPPTPDADLRASGQFRIRATVVTEPGTVALGYLYVSVQPVLDAQQNTFYIHGNSGNFLPEPVPIGTYGFGGLSRHETDPRWPDEPIPFSGNGLVYSGTTIQKHFTSEAIPNPARFIEGQPIKGRLEFRSQAAMTGTLAVAVRMGDKSLGEHSRPVSFTTGSTPIEFEMPVLPDVDRVDPANGTVYALIRLTIDQPYGTLVASNLVPLTLLPKTSWLKLPVEREEIVLPKEARFRVSLVATEELQSFVNPGRTTVHELDLRNEDDRRLVLTVEAENQTEGWTYEIRPAARIRLDASDAAHLGIVVTAPASAKEGSESKVKIVAREGETLEVVGAQWVRTIVTAGVEIENETFEVRDEDAQKVDLPSSKGSPTVGLVTLLLAIAGLVAVRRR